MEGQKRTHYHCDVNGGVHADDDDDGDDEDEDEDDDEDIVVVDDDDDDGGGGGGDVDDVDFEQEEEDDDVEEENRSHDRAAHFVGACAVEMHMHMSQEPFWCGSLQGKCQTPGLPPMGHRAFTLTVRTVQCGNTVWGTAGNSPQ